MAGTNGDRGTTGQRAADRRSRSISKGWRGRDDLRITIAGLNPKESDNLEKIISKEDDDNKFEAFKDSIF